VDVAGWSHAVNFHFRVSFSVFWRRGVSWTSRGMRNQNVPAFAFSAVDANRSAICCSTIALQMARPSPVPPFCLASLASTCLYRSKMLSRNSLGMPRSVIGDREFDSLDRQSRRRDRSMIPAARI